MSQYSPQEEKQLLTTTKDLIKSEQPSDLASSKLQTTQLHEVIVYHEWRYYIKDQPVISDFEYDSLFKRLEAIEAKFPELITPDSPTQRVSNDLTSDFPAVPHLTPMLSLENSYNGDDLFDFDKRVRKLLKMEEEEAAIRYCVEPKFDGGTIVLVYENDLLVRAATRGNGVQGEEITANARTMKTIPLKANFSKYGIAKVELRGEALIGKERFEKANAIRLGKGKELFANPRNAATGALRLKDPKKVTERGIETFVYQISTALDAEGNEVLLNLNTHNDCIEMLGDLGV